jgi:integrase
MTTEAPEKAESRKRKNKKKRWEGRIYLGRDEKGKQLFHRVGRFDTRRERDVEVAKARVALAEEATPELPTCDEYVDRFCADYKRRNKYSSYVSTVERLKRFRDDFADQPLDISRTDAKDWAAGEGKWAGKKPVRSGALQSVVTLYNHAIDEDDLPLERNPFRKLGRRTRGRADEAPPTEAEFEALLDACSALGEYGETMRALMLFAAFTLMRPSELYMLEWTDIDFDAMRVRKRQRLFRGNVDEPKYGEATIALTRPARDAILGLPRDGRFVFRSITGKRMSQSGLSGYWGKVKVRAGLDFDFYHATKHYGVHFMWTKLNLPRRAIAAQAGWSLSTIDKMLAIYGHGEVGALEEVDAAFANDDSVPAGLTLIPGGKQ